MQNLIKCTENLIKETEVVKTLLESGFKDLSNAHKVRWDLFLLWCKLGGSVECYIYHGLDDIFKEHMPKGSDDPFSYDGAISCERHETVCLLDALPRLVELLAEETPEFEESITKQLESLGFTGSYTDSRDYPIGYWKAYEDASKAAHKLPALAAYETALQTKLMEDSVSSFVYD